MESILTAANLRAGVVGTIAYRVGGAATAGGGQRETREGDGTRTGEAPPSLLRAAPLTTPGALALHAVLAEMRAAGATDVVLEATSHALVQRRLDGCAFRVAGLTNVTRDHLDYHGTMERYLDAKALLFEERLEANGGVAVLPLDQPAGRALRGRLPAGRVLLGIAVSRAETAGVPVDVAVESFVSTPEGLRVRLATPVGHLDLVSALVGDFNLANITLAVGMAIGRGLPADSIVHGIERLPGVPGRLERVTNARGVLAIVDYAHTPDALERAMRVLRPLVEGDGGVGGRLITVFGCGGDRDRGKRPVMGEAAVRDSELAIITSDNPRGEDPRAIIDEIVAGAERAGAPALASAAALATARRGFHVEPDRREAIRAAVAASRAGDVLLVAGKGHEDYQLIAGRRIHFDDREELAAAFDAPAPASGNGSGSGSGNAGASGEPGRGQGRG
jgi:UDP-N-acetylmuramoyl-L-alanyl-D-glutamate--2,6-diaminopimelate ligase